MEVRVSWEVLEEKERCINCHKEGHPLFVYDGDVPVDPATLEEEIGETLIVDGACLECWEKIGGLF